MQCRFLFSVSVALALFTTHSSAAPFQNLDFEQANTNTLSYDPATGVASGPIQDLLPGWQVITSRPGPIFFGFTNTLESLQFDSERPEGVRVSLFDYDPFPSVPRTGHYSLVSRSDFMDGSVSLIQRGDVPSDALTLQGDGIFYWGWGGTTSVTMNGVPLQLSASGVGLDVSPFAGQNVEFRYDLIGGWTARMDGFRFTLGTAFSGITRNSNGTISIRWTGGGTLQSAAGVNGPWQDVTGATNPYTFMPTVAMLFARIRQ